MPRDAAATKSRILDAAFREFARFGLAGARVERIAADADANKRLIYVYFSSKEALFDVVLAQRLAALAAALPFDARSLGAYAGDLFDYFLANPEILRLTMWAQLERPEPTSAEIAVYQPKVAAVAAEQTRGTIRPSVAPADLLTLVLGTIKAWFYASPALRAVSGADGDAGVRIAAHRIALIASVERLIAAAPPPHAY